MIGLAALEFMRKLYTLLRLVWVLLTKFIKFAVDAAIDKSLEKTELVPIFCSKGSHESRERGADSFEGQEREEKEERTKEQLKEKTGSRVKRSNGCRRRRKFAMGLKEGIKNE